ncbi:hypothetical protein ISN45_Aa07g027290 [Arabidopsis thaliana x Arabidopsis arenosa]|uniref:HMA domain-containing protein n=2 Tax=Arabidopsis TaxID=3701 RepID=A0A8T1YMI9_ARASU|nr:hypothetical protein ISN45_Aa07g027290 [Arabidopsis thaliana x Arabidopsis arenosa]KAG7547447.1 hypothetical protein ISN44_As12g026910 [Arabidopsis suecica]
MGCCLPLLPKNSPKNVEFKMPKCSICEKAMTDAISKFRGVTICVVDKENQKIKAIGSFNQELLLKKLMKVIQELEIHDGENDKNDESEINQKNEEKLKLIPKKREESKMVEEELAKAKKKIDPNSDEHKQIEKIMMFNEENTNARCTIS